MSRTLTTIGLVMMGFVLLGSIVRAGQKLASGAPAVRTVSAATTTNAGDAVGDVQRIALSFGGFNYSPDTIRVRKGVPVEITGDTSKLRGCFSSFVIPELNIWGQFTTAKNKIAFTPQRAGTFKFSCAMGMGSGRLVVEG